jgi:hypothetical protein
MTQALLKGHARGLLVHEGDVEDTEDPVRCLVVEIQLKLPNALKLRLLLQGKMAVRPLSHDPARERLEVIAVVGSQRLDVLELELLIERARPFCNVRILDANVPILDANVPIRTSDVCIWDSDVCIWDSDVCIWDSDVRIWDSDVRIPRAIDDLFPRLSV